MKLGRSGHAKSNGPSPPTSLPIWPENPESFSTRGLLSQRFGPRRCTTPHETTRKTFGRCQTPTSSVPPSFLGCQTPCVPFLMTLPGGSSSTGTSKKSKARRDHIACTFQRAPKACPGEGNPSRRHTKKARQKHAFLIARNRFPWFPSHPGPPGLPGSTGIPIRVWRPRSSCPATMAGRTRCSPSRPSRH